MGINGDMKKQLLPLWENPEIQEINRLPMNSPLQPFVTVEDALADAIAGPEFRSADKNLFYLGLDTPGIWENAVVSSPWKFKIMSNPADDLPASGECLVVGRKRDDCCDNADCCDKDKCNNDKIEASCIINLF